MMVVWVSAVAVVSEAWQTGHPGPHRTLGDYPRNHPEIQSQTQSPGQSCCPESRNQEEEAMVVDGRWWWLCHPHGVRVNDRL